MAAQELENFDIVSVDGELGEWTIVETRSNDTFLVQFGADAATRKYVAGTGLTLVRKAEKPDGDPGFYPGRSIME